MDFRYFRVLQKRQFKHDDTYALVDPRPRSEHAKRWTLHLAGISAEIRETKEPFPLPLLLDGFSTVLSAANEMNMNLEARVKSVHDANPDTQAPLFVDMVTTVGRMSKVCDEIDHFSDYPTRREMEQCVARLAYSIDLEFTRNHVNISKALNEHLAAIEDEVSPRPMPTLNFLKAQPA